MYDLKRDNAKATRDIARLIGRPYSSDPKPPNSFDCFALVKEARDIAGLASPDFIYPSTYEGDALERTSRIIVDKNPAFKNIIEPTDWCIVTMGKRRTHIGCMFPGEGIIHAVEHRNKNGQVRLDKLDSMKRYYGTVEFWEVERAG